MNRLPSFTTEPVVVDVAVHGGESRFRLATVAETMTLNPKLIQLEDGYAVIVVDAGPLAPVRITDDTTRDEVEAEHRKALVLRAAAALAGARLRELVNPRIGGR